MCWGSSEGAPYILTIHTNKEILRQAQARTENHMSVLHPKQSVNKKQSEI
jgi:hypothetical protein